MILRLLPLVALLLLPATGLAQSPSASEEVPVARERPVFLDLSIGTGIVSRHLRFHDDLYGVTRPYDLAGGASFGFDARIHPGAFARHELAGTFGLGVRYDRTAGATSESSEGAVFPTANQRIEIDAIERFRLGAHELAGSIGYGNHAFVLGRSTPTSPSTNAVPEVPNVRYSYLRLGIETRLRAHRWVSFRVGAAYLQVFDAGGIEDASWFPRARSAGIELTTRLVVPITHGLEGRLGIEYRRYFFAMRPEVGDPRIVGGALDQYADVRLELAYRY